MCRPQLCDRYAQVDTWRTWALRVLSMLWKYMSPLFCTPGSTRSNAQSYNSLPVVNQRISTPCVSSALVTTKSSTMTVPEATVGKAALSERRA